MATQPYGVNTSGSLVPAAPGVPFLTGTSVNGMTAGSKVVYKDNLGNIEVYDGTEANGHAIVGISDGAAVVAGGTVTYCPVNGLVTLTPAFTVGTTELYAKNNGDLGVFSSLTTGDYTRRVGTLSKNNGAQFYVDFDIVMQVP